MMSDFLKNKALSTYFLLDALLHEEVERKALMKKIAQIFCVKKQSFKLFAECDKEAVKEIKNVVTYNRYRRLKEYRDLQGYPDPAADDTVAEELISIKGKVFTELKRLKITTADDANGTDVLLELTQRANKGIALAMYAYGIILCAGSGVEANIDEGIKYLKKVADWGNIEACIFCIYYCRDLKNEYGNKLYTYLLSTPYVSEINALSVQYGLSPEKDEIAALTCKMFAHRVAAAEQYDWQLARILKCGALSEPDKQDIVLSGGKDMIKRVSALPLNIKSWENYPVKELAVDFGAEAEKKAVELSLNNIDTLTSEKYRPLCICSDDLYMLDKYSEAISRALDGCNVFTVNLSGLSTENLNKQFGAEILHAIKENGRNAVIIRVCGEALAYPAYGQLILQVVCGVLNTEKRRAFRTDLNFPLNLLQLLPVVLCDGQNLSKFRTTCHVVKLAEMTERDRRKAIEETVKVNAGIYELSSVKIEDAAMDKLVEMKCNNAVAVLDKLFASYDDGSDIVITPSDVDKFSDENETTRAGF